MGDLAAFEMLSEERDRLVGEVERLAAEVERLREALRKFIAFQHAGYLAGQAYEETYAVLVKEARAALHEQRKGEGG